MNFTRSTFQRLFRHRSSSVHMKTKRVPFTLLIMGASAGSYFYQQQSHMEKGCNLFRMNKFPEAEEEFKKALQSDSQNSEAHRVLGCTLISQGRIEEGVSFIERAIELNPKNDAAHHSYGDVLMQYGDINDAVAEFELAVNLLPNSQNYLSLAEALEKSGQIQESMAAFDKATSLQPLNAETHLQAACAYYRMGNKLLAKGESLTASDLDPLNPVAHLLQGWMFQEEGKFEKAEQEYQFIMDVADPTEWAYFEAQKRIGSNYALRSAHFHNLVLPNLNGSV